MIRGMRRPHLKGEDSKETSPLYFNGGVDSILWVVYIQTKIYAAEFIQPNSEYHDCLGCLVGCYETP